MMDWWQFDFMRLALFAVILLAPLYGLLGTVVVDGRMAFFSDSLGHSALTGIALGVVFGMDAPLWAMLLFGVAFALLLMAVKGRGAASTDTTIGVFSATAVALGIVLLSRNGGFAKYSYFLIGDLLAIAPNDLWTIAAALLAVVLFWLWLYNRLLVAGVNHALAQSRGVAVRWVERGFACLIAVVVMVSIRWVGVLMINAMLVLPAAAARNLARNVRVYHLLSIGLAMVCGMTGLLLSYAWGTASGATIVLLLAVSYVATLFIRRMTHAG